MGVFRFGIMGAAKIGAKFCDAVSRLPQAQVAAVASKSQERADGRCAASLEGALRRTTTQYDTCITKSKDIRLRRGKVHYALLPVWMLHTKWQGKDYLFAMNGQTGKLVGDLPVDKRKVAAWFAGISVPLMILLAILL